MKYWLIKSEPESYSIDDLERGGVEHWDGIRNFQARNIMRDQMTVGDLVLFHHSNAKPPGIVGIAEVASGPYPDHTQFDPASKYFDETSDPADPRWIMVDMKFVAKFPRLVGMPELKKHPALSEMVLLNRSRLSVQPVTKNQFDYIVELAERSAD
ncbi:MAG TPA: EVE domain-containing protein [Acidimicrobiia bacterium]|nr:EVE domain-containing protein [Acidimicrobiia bacterium]